MAIYVDNFIIFSPELDKIINSLKEKKGYNMKGVGVPEYYRRGDIPHHPSRDPLMDP